VFKDPGKEFTIFTDRDNKHYSKEVRRKYANSFSLSNVAQYEEPLNKSLSLLCKKFTQMADENSECDLAKWCRFFSFDSIAEMACGDLRVMELGRDENGIMDMTYASVIYGNIV